MHEWFPAPPTPWRAALINIQNGTWNSATRETEGISYHSTTGRVPVYTRYLTHCPFVIDRGLSCFRNYEFHFLPVPPTPFVYSRFFPRPSAHVRHPPPEHYRDRCRGTSKKARKFRIETQYIFPRKWLVRGFQTLRDRCSFVLVSTVDGKKRERIEYPSLEYWTLSWRR